MSDIKLSSCKCGGIAAFVVNNVDPEQTIHVHCDTCGLRTPEKKASLESSAKQDVADIWNAGENMWSRWVKPAVATDAYAKGDQVTWTAQGQERAEHWISNMDGNVHEPGVSGWKLVGYAD